MGTKTRSLYSQYSIDVGFCSCVQTMNYNTTIIRREQFWLNVINYEIYNEQKLFGIESMLSGYCTVKMMKFTKFCLKVNIYNENFQ